MTKKVIRNLEWKMENFIGDRGMLHTLRGMDASDSDNDRQDIIYGPIASTVGK